MSRFDLCRRTAPLLALFIVACATTSNVDQSRGEILKDILLVGEGALAMPPLSVLAAAAEIYNRDNEPLL